MCERRLTSCANPTQRQIDSAELDRRDRFAIVRAEDGVRVDDDRSTDVVGKHVHMELFQTFVVLSRRLRAGFYRAAGVALSRWESIRSEQRTTRRMERRRWWRLTRSGKDWSRQVWSAMSEALRRTIAAGSSILHSILVRRKQDRTTNEAERCWCTGERNGGYLLVLYGLRPSPSTVKGVVWLGSDQRFVQCFTHRQRMIMKAPHG